MKNLMISMLFLIFLVSCSGKGNAPSDSNSSNVVKDFIYTENDTTLTEEGAKVDLAESLADVKGCERLEESSITFKANLATSMVDVFVDRIEENMAERWETLARNAAARMGANTVRLVGVPKSSWTSTESKQAVAFYNCN